MSSSHALKVFSRWVSTRSLFYLGSAEALAGVELFGRLGGDDADFNVAKNLSAIAPPQQIPVRR